MTSITKQMLANSLKHLLQKTTLDRITVQMIVDDAKVSRKTFYYHFQDVYDLAQWIFQEDSAAMLQNLDNAASIEETLHQIFLYFTNHRTFIQNVYHSFELRLQEKMLIQLTLPYIHQFLTRQPGFLGMEPKDQDFILRVVSYGLAGMMLEWIGSGMPPMPDDLAQQLARYLNGDLIQSIYQNPPRSNAGKS